MRDVTSIDLTAFFDEWLFSSRWGTVVSAAKRRSDLSERHRRKARKAMERLRA